MRVIPVDPEQFSEFIDKSKIFDKTIELMTGYLTNWYKDSAETFIENMRADLPAVLERYRFCHERVSITKNFNFDPPVDTVSCTVRITDEEDDYFSQYTAVFDVQMTAIDDYMR